jgi:RNA polymerase sigma factor (sigma-70 family)
MGPAGARDEHAFERLYRRHSPDVYRFALALLRDPSDAEDVTQTTFLNAFRAYGRGERPRSARSWLIAIAHNICRQRFRQAARRPHEVALDAELVEGAVPETTPSAEDIRRALGQLAFNQRSALVMRELEGRSYEEIAEALGLTTSAVETLLFRARRAVREQLEGDLTCEQAELALSRQADDRLPRAERGALRAHLRACPDCARAARSLRAQRSAWKGLAAVPLPQSLAALFGGGGGAAVGGGLAVKAAAVVAAGAVVGGGAVAALDAVERKTLHPDVASTTAARPASQAAPRTALTASFRSRAVVTPAQRTAEATRGGPAARHASPARAGASKPVKASAAVKLDDPTAGEPAKPDRLEPKKAKKAKKPTAIVAAASSAAPASSGSERGRGASGRVEASPGRHRGRPARSRAHEGHQPSGLTKPKPAKRKDKGAGATGTEHSTRPNEKSEHNKLEPKPEPKLTPEPKAKHRLVSRPAEKQGPAQEPEPAPGHAEEPAPPEVPAPSEPSVEHGPPADHSSGGGQGKAPTEGPPGLAKGEGKH